MNTTSIFTNPYLVALFSATVGGAITYILTRFLNKRSLFSYNYYTEKIAISASDKVFGNIKVTWQDAPVENLYLSTFHLRNASLKDYKDLKLRVYCDAGVTILNDTAFIVNSTQVVGWTDEYRRIIYVESGQAPTEAQSNIYYGQREYLAPVVNRGDMVQIQILVVSHHQRDPMLHLELSHPGTKLKKQGNYNVILGVPISITLPLGFTVSALFTVLFVFNLGAPLLVSFLILIFGLFSQPIAAILYLGFKKLYKIFTD